MTTKNAMTRPELFKKASGGNKEALRFLTAVYEHFDKMHTFIVEKRQNPHDFIALMAETNLVFSLPFYSKHAHELHVSVWRVVQGLGKEVSFSLVSDVAFITLGFEGARKMLVELGNG